MRVEGLGLRVWGQGLEFWVSRGTCGDSKEGGERRGGGWVGARGVELGAEGGEGMLVPMFGKWLRML